MKKLVLSFIKAVCALCTVFAFVSCSSKIAVRAQADSSQVLDFSLSFSEETAKALRIMTGADSNVPLFSESDAENLLGQAGAKEIKVSMPSSNVLSASGKITKEGGLLSACGVLLRTEKSLSLSLGPEQFTNFYSILSEEFKAYFDLMMIPCLIGEKMTAEEYEKLLSSMYGPAFAKEIVSGTLDISLLSPDGTKKVSDRVSLGEILTMEQTGTWTVKW